MLPNRVKITYSRENIHEGILTELAALGAITWENYGRYDKFTTTLPLVYKTIQPLTETFEISSGDEMITVGPDTHEYVWDYVVRLNDGTDIRGVVSTGMRIQAK